MSVNNPASRQSVPAPSTTALAGPGKAKRATSRELLGDGDQLVIEHEGREYRLRRTQNGKLILTA